MGKWIVLVILGLVLAFFYGQRDDFDPGSIRNSRVLVTGASSGIGEQLAYAYARLGARLVVTARRAELLTEVERHCRELGAAFVAAVPADMAVAADRARLVAETERLVGGLDHLVLNHAMFEFLEWTGAPENLTTLERYLAVDFLSYVDVASRAIDMLRASRGRIGVVSSVAGKMSSPMAAPYVASKHALQGFFATWRQELAYRDTGVSVTICVLGLIDTQKAMEMISRHYAGMGREDAVSAIDTAAAILRSVTLREYELYHPSFAYWIVTMHKLAPAFLERHMLEYLK